MNYYHGECSGNAHDMLLGMDDEPLGTIGERIKNLREETGLSQEELGAALAQVGYKALGQAAISHIEKGRKEPTPAGLVAFARYFGTSVDYLLGVTNNQLSSEDIEEELAAGGIGGRFERVMARLSPARREQVVEYADYLASLDQVSVKRTQNLRDLHGALNELRQLVPANTLNSFLTLLGRGDASMARELLVLLNPEQERVDLFKD